MIMKTETQRREFRQVRERIQVIIKEFNILRDGTRDSVRLVRLSVISAVFYAKLFAHNLTAIYHTLNSQCYDYLYPCQILLFSTIQLRLLQ